MSDIKRIDIAEFREDGYLQEVNRNFLHPYGLALEVVGGLPEEISEARRCHDEAAEEDGFIICKCGAPLPSWDVWGDHYADAVLLAVFPSGVPDEVLGGVWDYRDDPEGIAFAPGVLDPEKAERLANLWAERRPAREERLGYMVQPADDAGRVDDFDEVLP